MKIGELASRSGCSVQTIRYYEKKSLLPAPSRSEGNFRLYDRSIFDQLMFIKRCRSLDLTLEEIRELIDFKASPEMLCDNINAIVEEHLSHVEARIHELKCLQKQLLSLRQTCSEHRKVEQCGILQELSQRN
ncbi:Cd(II)/Pb(II)-responsive transcriptional regulator [Aliikangiella sp. IMCC44359]|uniref:Cd(II)/Pb(II)-responsive transcriptional regulator n=1 Tax=Aliikangiella sp. IMCC44359 TaxID=3459125 RepID=UPI00403A9328